jgi:hypothetical protein
VAPEREEVAYHEAAHAVLHVILGYDLEWVSIEPNVDTHSEGETKGTILPPAVTKERLARGDSFTEEELVAISDNVTNLLAGEVAEARLRGERYQLDPLAVRTRDEQWAIGQVQSVCGSANGYARADRELAALIRRAEELLDRHWAFVERVAEGLIVKRRLTGEEVVSLGPATDT